MLVQEEIDRLTELGQDTSALEPQLNVLYSTVQGALEHGYLSALGELDPSEYHGNPMTPVLMILFVLLSFFMCIHLLNMLITIMGQSFDENAEIAESNRKISQLEFVVNNWWIHPIKNKNQIIYFVAAFAVQDEVDNEFEDLDLSIQETRQMIKS